MTRHIVEVIGTPETITRLADIGIFPGQSVQILRDGLWKINNRFTVAFRLTNTKIVLE
jgi:Fe2+ transport system protein FeoA